MSIFDLNQRSLDIFKHLVDAFIKTGEPVGSSAICKQLDSSISSATIRNVMADLEKAGLLYAPHTSAGRLPTCEGLQFFVNGLLEIGDLSKEEKLTISKKCKKSDKNLKSLLEQATQMLSGLSSCAGIVVSPKINSTLKHIEFVRLNDNKALMIIINEDNIVENRIIELNKYISQDDLLIASNYLNSNFKGRNLDDIAIALKNDLDLKKSQINDLVQKIIKKGIGTWSGDFNTGSLIIKGQSHLLQNVQNLQEVDNIRNLFLAIEEQENIENILNSSIKAQGVQIFIGSKNNLFSLSGCSMVISPYMNNDKVIGAIGVIGPSRMNYSKVIPLVDYTAKIIGKMLK